MDAAALRTLRDGLDEGSESGSGGIIEEVTCAGFDDDTIIRGGTMDARQWRGDESLYEFGSSASNVGGNRIGTWGTGGQGGMKLCF